MSSCFLLPVLEISSLPVLGHLNLLAIKNHSFIWQEWTKPCFLIFRVIWGYIFFVAHSVSKYPPAPDF